MSRTGQSTGSSGFAELISVVVDLGYGENRESKSSTTREARREMSIYYWPERVREKEDLTAPIGAASGPRTLKRHLFGTSSA